MTPVQITELDERTVTLGVGSEVRIDPTTFITVGEYGPAEPDALVEVHFAIDSDGNDITRQVAELIAAVLAGE